MTSAVHVFNQYYWDLLKKVKDLAKDFKYRSNDCGARDILREIKRSYLTFDKLSEEHVTWYREHMQPFDDFLLHAAGSMDRVLSWKDDENVCACSLYQGINLRAVVQLFKNTNIVLYYVVLMSMFATPDISSGDAMQHVIALLRKKHPWSEEDIASVEKSGASEHVLLRLRVLQNILITPTTGSNNAGTAPKNADTLMDELENTSLGRLAKEIMHDVDVEELSKSIGDDGDILKALSNPDGGITKLLGTVSQKMISKLASGELKQENLMEDAMKLAGKLPSMSGGASSGLGDMASMMQQVGKLASMFGGDNTDRDGGDLDMGAMMSQFSQMMGGAGPKPGKGTRTVVNHQTLNRAARSKQLRRKLEERRKKHEEP